MSRSFKIGSLAVAVTAAAALIIAPAAGAADPPHPVIYLGLAGGTEVTAADGTVTSGLTAESYLQGFVVPASSHNDVAQAQLGDLLSTGAITSDENADAQGAGAVLTSHAKTLGISLLNGLITADVADTTSTAAFDGATLSAVTTTQLAGIKIQNVTVPVNIPQNFTVSIPGIARITLNYNVTYKNGDSISTFGAGIFVQLLGSFESSPLGTEVFVNPSYAAVSAHVPHSPVILGGSTYGTRLTLNALEILGIDSGRTALQSLPAGGTSGETRTNSTAAVSIPDVLQTGVVQTTIRGTHTNSSGDALTTSSIANVNLFDGLITVDAIKTSAHVHLAKSGAMTITNKVKLVGLSIAGHTYPVSVSPNTRINVAGLGTVILNQQYGTSFDTNVRAIDIKLSTARAGLPVGATIEVGFASAYIIS